jgi:hypothetical protein
MKIMQGSAVAPDQNERHEKNVHVNRHHRVRQEVADKYQWKLNLIYARVILYYRQRLRPPRASNLCNINCGKDFTQTLPYGESIMLWMEVSHDERIK